MTRPVDADTLRGWLDEGRRVTVLDIRTDEDRAQWAIPGSLHINAYEALRAGEPGALAHATLPADQPVITICNAGRVSQTAADILAARGLDARSLSGGMKAWSLAWNTADVPLRDDAIHVVQVRRTGKGCLSYIVASDGDALVVDPSLPPDVYLDVASQRGWRIRSLVETHIHADHLSRARELAQRAGAQLFLPAQQRVHFPFTAVADRDVIRVGRATLTARRTPGHTDESTSYVLNGEAIFTGDTLFTKGVGRPDLHADVEGGRQRARALFRSLTQLRTLGREMLVLPAHASEPIPFDRRPVAARMSDLGAWLSEWLLSEDAFVEWVGARVPETPPNFTRIVALNEAGHLPEGDATDLEAGANRCAVS